MIAIVDYGLNNVMSVFNAFERLGCGSRIVRSPAELKQVSGVVLPGVGSFSAGVQALQSAGWACELKRRALEGVPILGICLGMQMLAEASEEAEPGTRGLGLLPGISLRFSDDVKVPHVGWNRVRQIQKDPLMEGIDDGAHMYFTHSYYFPFSDDNALAVTEYGRPFASAIREGTIFGVQFHPEKSASDGLRLLNNFSEVAGRDQ